MDRRHFLSTLALTSACSVRRTKIQPPAAPYSGRRLAPVNVSNERIIRTVTGLRPFRPSGFVVRTESIEGKTIVHGCADSAAANVRCAGCGSELRPGRY